MNQNTEKLNIEIDKLILMQLSQGFLHLIIIIWDISGQH